MSMELFEKPIGNQKGNNMAKIAKKHGGWNGESHRHQLAAYGIKSTPTSPMARLGESNGRWNGGKSKTYYRRIAGCKTNDGKIVHHKDHDKSNISPGNFEVLDNRGNSAQAKHNKAHPEKGAKKNK